MNADVGFAVALLGGALSFVSPCVLPLVPAYLSFLAGAGLDDLTAAGAALKRRTFLRALAFVAGFSTVFVALGAGASALSALLRAHMDVLAMAAGVVVVILGLHFMGVFRLSFLDREARFHVERKPLGPLGAYLIGLAFAFGWTPCIGPILGSILAVAATREGMADGIALLAVYSAGLGIPFLIAALGVGAFTRFLQRFRRSMRYVEIAIGLLLVATGVAMATGALQTTGTVLFQWFPWMQEIG
ncbi:MAG: cytochrome c biogenesis protein CcdA [Sphingomonadales bacterium]|nr:cytochrome c biogenesis protein CcdA [Sphingomonadales bacterium]